MTCPICGEEMNLIGQDSYCEFWACECGKICQKVKDCV